MFRRTNRLRLGAKIRVWQKSHTPWQIAELEPTWYPTALHSETLLILRVNAERAAKTRLVAPH